jgi:hypothetical protein
MPGSKRPPDGHISTTRIARRLRVDRRVLKRLYELDRIAGVRAGGVIWLERRSLAAYLWSRPRCIRNGCSRRVIGAGPGCHLHRRDGRRRPRVTLRPRKRTPLTGDRLERLQEGRRLYRAEVERVKAERELLDVDELLERLRRAGVPRSLAAISGYVRDGLLEPERGHGFVKPQLFTEASVDELERRLRSHLDGRLVRFNDPARRGAWINARHGISFARRAWGAANKAGSAAKGTVVGRPPGSGSVLTRQLQQRIDVLRGEGQSNRAIAREIHVSEATVRRYRPAS